MRTKLAIIAVSGLAVSAISLGGAFALGGNAIGDAVFNFSGFDLPRCDMSGPAATAISRTLPWQGDGDEAAVALPADVHYQTGNGDQLVVKGDPDAIAHVRVHDGVVGMDCDGGHFRLGRSNRIDVTLPGKRSFRSFDLRGLGSMQLSGLSQPAVTIVVTGTGTVEADGKTDHLEVDVRGAGDMKLGALVAKNADVDIAGSGKVEVAPQDSLNVDIKGSGTIYLRNEPKKLETSIHGSGHIVHPDGETQSMPGHSRHARLEDDAIRAAVLQALTNDDGDYDRDRGEMDRAKAHLRARIRARVAEELERAKIGPDQD